MSVAPLTTEVVEQHKLGDGSISRTLKDGHHEVVDKKGNMEVDDLEDDQKSYCEEMDVTNADGTIVHVKKWHHHTVDHFGEHKAKYGAFSVVALALGLGLGLGLAVAVATSGASASEQRSAALAASAGTTLETVTVVPAKGDSTSRRRLTDSSGAFDTFERLHNS